VTTIDAFIPTVGDLRTAATPLLVLLSVRLLPTLAYVVFTSGLRTRSKLAVLTAVSPLLLGTIAVFGSLLAYSAGGVAYYAIAACAIYGLIPWLRAARITRGAILTLAVALFLFLPSLVLPGIAAAAFLVLGFDAVFSIYSYCVEQAKTSSAPRLAECLFFVLVDPTLVYVNRSRPIASPALHGGGLLRLLWGVVGLLGAQLLLVPLGAIAPQNPDHPLTELRGLAAIAPFVALQFLTTYFQHSSLASFRIGVMRQLGYQTPECYAYPLFATNPADFWRRWNMYLGAWIRRYVYLPLTLQIARSLGARTQTVAKATGVIIAFVIVGLIHAVFAYTESFQVSAAWIGWFTVHGCLLVAWVGVATFVRKLPARFRSGARELAAPALLTRLMFLGALGSSIAYWTT
jgi:hypothetical protein